MSPIRAASQAGRSQEAKSQLFDRITNELASVGVDGADVFIGYVENWPGDWSFGFGRAQYMTGELTVPAG